MVKIAVTAEGSDEPRVAVSPETVKKYVGLGCKVAVEQGAGARSRYSDGAMKDAGAEDVKFDEEGKTINLLEDPEDE